ncbi:MAG: PEP-CTERM sorting domain-containing protein [bacterium]
MKKFRLVVLSLVAIILLNVNVSMATQGFSYVTSSYFDKIEMYRLSGTNAFTNTVVTWSESPSWDIVTAANFVALSSMVDVKGLNFELSLTNNTPLSFDFFVLDTSPGFNIVDSYNIHLDNAGWGYYNNFIDQASALARYNRDFLLISGAEPVPEPGTLLLLGCGVFGIVVFSKRSHSSLIA